MRSAPGQEVHITTVVVRRPPGAAPLDPERLHRTILAGLYRTRSNMSWLYLCLSIACLAGAVWAAYRAFHPL